MVSLVLLEEIPDDAVDTFGGKACALATVKRAGLPVPAGFVIPCEALREVLASRSLGAEIARAAEVPAEAEKRVADILAARPMPPTLRDELLHAFRELGGEAVAVRSSAPSEDGAGRSFAGQFRTLLGIESGAALEDAVRACWASAWSERSLRYQEQLDGADRAPEMAVLVQRMVTPRAAGVLFTRAPDDQSQMQIESVAGLGDAVVDGEVTPDSYRLPRTRSAPTSARGSLEPSDLERLRSLGLELEARFGRPLDVEWAIDASGLQVLQARPITTAPPVDRSDEDWSPVLLSDRFPKPLTPIEWTVVRDWVVVEPLRQLLAYLGCPVPELDELGRLADDGRPLLNMRRLIESLSTRLPGHAAASAIPGANPEMAPKGFPLATPLTGVRMLVAALRRPSEWQSESRRYLETLRALETFEPGSLDTAEISDRVETLRREVAGLAWKHIRTVIVSEFLNDALKGLIERAGFPDPAGMAAALTTGGRDNATVRETLEIEALAKTAQRSPKVRELLEVGSRGGWAEVLPELRDPAAEEFRRAFEAFLDRYGHRTFSYHIDEPTFADDPGQVLSLVWAALETGATSASHALELSETRQRAAERRLRLGEGDISRFAIAPVRRAIGALARLTRTFVGVLRDDENMVIFQTWRVFKRLLAAAPPELLRPEGFDAPPVRLGASVTEREELVFMTIGEVQDRLRCVDDPDLGARMTKRRLRHREQLEGRKHSVTAVEGDLSGNPASPGVAIGTVVCLETPSDAASLPSDAILVVRATTPAWTTFLLRARAIVTDVGGVLSHAAIIARECSIPAVTGTGNATGALSTGQRVRVDGNTGMVHVLDESSLDDPKEAEASDETA